MDALLKAAAKTSPAPELSWREDDPVSDWTLELGEGARSYKVHSAVVASGSKRSDAVRNSLIGNSSSRKTDVLSLMPEVSRPVIVGDPHFVQTFECMLDWQYGIVEALSLPFFDGTRRLVSTPSQTAGSVNAAADCDEEEDPGMFAYFSTAIFGATPSKSTPSAMASGRLAATSRTAHVRAEQVPLLWALANDLSVRGLKSALAPIFEAARLPRNYVMHGPAYERLKM